MPGELLRGKCGVRMASGQLWGAEMGVLGAGQLWMLPSRIWLFACTLWGWAHAWRPAGNAGPPPTIPAPLPSWRLSWPLLSCSCHQPRQTSLGPAQCFPPSRPRCSGGTL